MIRRTRLLAAAVLVLTLICLFFHHTYSTIFNASKRQQLVASLSPANSTLGFGAILAVSHPSSPRRQSLLWAANLTDLDIVIPEQKIWDVGDVKGLTIKQGSRLSTGSAKAWLGHLEVLRWYVG